MACVYNKHRKELKSNGPIDISNMSKCPVPFSDIGYILLPTSSK